MKNSNLSSKMALLFFNVFSFMIYTLLHAFELYYCGTKVNFVIK